jgi:hypothetical protein
MNEIYAVMYACYSDWHIYGYFTNKYEAEQYCLAHEDRELFVETLPCYDGQEDVSRISVKYEHHVEFNKKDSGWVMFNDPDNYYIYSADYLHSNSIKIGYGNYLSIQVNICKNDRKLAEKIAQDNLYQFLAFCNNKPNRTKVDEFNNILNKDERERLQKEKEAKIREEELAQLAALKAKYEKE